MQYQIVLVSLIYVEKYYSLMWNIACWMTSHKQCPHFDMFGLVDYELINGLIINYTLKYSMHFENDV